MAIKFKARCERVRKNNGVLEILFTRRPPAGELGTQEWHVLMNIEAEQNQYEEGSFYWVSISPAFPHQGDSK